MNKELTNGVLGGFLHIVFEGKRDDEILMSWD